MQACSQLKASRSFGSHSRISAHNTAQLRGNVGT